MPSRPHYSKICCAKKNTAHRTTVEAVTDMIPDVPLPEDTEMVVMGDTAYDAKVVWQACNQRNFLWVTPANSDRVHERSQSSRSQLRLRLKDGRSFSAEHMASVLLLLGSDRRCCEHQ